MISNGRSLLIGAHIDVLVAEGQTPSSVRRRLRRSRDASSVSVENGGSIKMKGHASQHVPLGRSHSSAGPGAVSAVGSVEAVGTAVGKLGTGQDFGRFSQNDSFRR